VRSWAVYREPVRHAIHQLKYAGDMGLAESFSNSLLSILEKQNWNIDCIVPVPLNPHRQMERGYNQSMLLAIPLATALRLPLRPKALLRKRDTLSQTKLSAQERKQNLLGAFQAQAKYTRNQTVLLVDDVTTTGATLWACTQALLEAGAQAVYGLTLARSLLQPISPDPDFAA
jgi:ComF family protein